MNRANTAVSLAVGLTVLVFLADEWSHGAITRAMAETFHRLMGQAAPGLPTRTDEVSDGMLADLFTEARRITTEGSA